MKAGQKVNWVELMALGLLHYDGEHVPSQDYQGLSAMPLIRQLH